MTWPGLTFRGFCINTTWLHIIMSLDLVACIHFLNRTTDSAVFIIPGHHPGMHALVFAKQLGLLQQFMLTTLSALQSTPSIKHCSSFLPTGLHSAVIYAFCCMPNNHTQASLTNASHFLHFGDLYVALHTHHWLTESWRLCRVHLSPAPTALSPSMI